MRIDIISARSLNCWIAHWIIQSVKRAKENGLVEIHVHNLREYTTNKHRRVTIMLSGSVPVWWMQIEPIDRIISKLKGTQLR